MIDSVKKKKKEKSHHFKQIYKLQRFIETVIFKPVWRSSALFWNLQFTLYSHTLLGTLG